MRLKSAETIGLARWLVARHSEREAPGRYHVAVNDLSIVFLVECHYYRFQFRPNLGAVRRFVGWLRAREVARLAHINCRVFHSVARICIMKNSNFVLAAILCGRKR